MDNQLQRLNQMDKKITLQITSGLTIKIKIINHITECNKLQNTELYIIIS